jgi:CRISPR type IV-associated protein Csf1
MPHLIYPSDLICQGTGVANNLPDSIKVDSDGRCGVCGKPYQAGDEVDPLVIPKTFTVEHALDDPHASYRCLPCAAIMDEKEFIFRWGNAVVTKDAIYPCLKKIHRGHWFLKPPEPPFAFYLQVSKSQHVAWRSPVNYSREIVFFRLGEDVLKIRVSAIKSGKEASEALIEEHKRQYALKTIKRKPMRTALSFADMKGQRVGQSEFYPWVAELIDISPEMKEHVDTLLGLTNSEAYALDFVMTDGLEKPEPMNTTTI